MKTTHDYMIFAQGLIAGLALGLIRWKAVVVIAILIGIYHMFYKKPADPAPYRHPATGSFCHICGANFSQGEACDAGLHS